MRKLFSLIAAVLFAGSMFAAVGNLYYTFAPAYSGSNTGYANVYDVTIAGMDWSVPGNQKNDGFVRIGGGKNTGLDHVDRVITGKSQMGSEIAKVVLSHNGTSSDKITIHSIKMVVASDAAFSNVIETVEMTPTIAKQTAGTVDFVPTADMWATNAYYKFIINMSNSSTSNAGIDLTKIEFYSYLNPSSPAITAANVDFGLVITTSLPVVKNANLEVTGANLSSAIAYSVLGSNVSVAGNLTAEGGTLAVTLNAAAEGEISDTIVLTSGTTVAKVAVEAKVVETVGVGTKESPFSVADVVKLNNGIGTDKYWVMGYIVGCAANDGAIAESITNTNLAIGDAAEQTEDVVPVELPSGDIRTALNLVDNAGYLGKQVKLHGQLISYFSFKGVKTVDDYEFVEEPAGCDWDNIEFLGDGSIEQTFANQFKICVGDPAPNVVNIQTPGFGAATGIYITFPSAAFGEISLAEDQYTTGGGAQMLMYLSAFTAQETEVSVVCADVEYVFTVYNANGGSTTAISNTAAEAKAVKFFENGQLIIMMNNVKYNAQGAIVK